MQHKFSKLQQKEQNSAITIIINLNNVPIEALFLQTVHTH